MGCVVSDQSTLQPNEHNNLTTDVFGFNTQKNLVGSYGETADAHHIYVMVINGEEIGDVFHKYPGDISWCLCRKQIIWHDVSRCPVHNLH